MNAENIVTFLKRLESLSAADRAALKREAGSMLTEADGNALRVFYRVLPPGVPQWQESRFFAVGCLRCLYDSAEGGKQQLPALVGNLIHRGILSESAAHRAQVLLDLSWEEDGYMLTKLCQMVKLLHGKASADGIDFEKMLSDVLCWNAESQYVQRNWARMLFQTNDSNNELEKGE